MTPTLLPKVEYIVPSGAVSKSLKKALARTTKLQTARVTQFCNGGKGRERSQQRCSATQTVVEWKGKMYLDFCHDNPPK
jgi:hypothetical protein